MQNDFSNKLRLLLNELAILNQPESIDGKYFFNVETLKKLKDMSTEVYLCSDKLMNGTAIENAVPPATEPQAPFEKPIEPLKIEEIVKTLVEPEVVSETLAPESPVPEETLVEPIKEHVQPVKHAELEIQHSEAPKLKVAQNANVFDGKISITRRFEYINNLFSGNAQEFSLFLQALSNNSTAKVLEIYNTEFEARNWSRKSESASDFKSLILKIKN